MERIQELLKYIGKETRLSPVQCEEFLRASTKEKYDKGVVLASPGRTVDKSFLIISGCIRHYVKDARGQEFSKNFLRGPRFMVPSLTSFFLKRPSEIYCDTVTEVIAFSWEHETLMEFAERHPTTYRFLLRAVVFAFHRKEQKEIQLNRLSARERYVEFLEQHPGLVNEIPGHYVASYLSMRPETLSRIRAEFIS